MDLKEKFKDITTEAVLPEHHSHHELSAYLRKQGWIETDEKVVALQKPGEGNMNFVMRVITNQKTFILKQAMPWVHKYPQVAAPVGRAEVEATFYQLMAQNETLKTFTPELIGFDQDHFILALEDVGEGADYTFLYQKGKHLTPEEIQPLMRFISQLHTIRADQQKMTFPENREMKTLNHEHIFSFPFLEENGLNLDTVQEGLQDLSLAYKRNAALKNKISDLGKIYLETGNTLIHGDYYPGSWLKVPSGLKIIDPEFGYLGQPEFDMGVMAAHFKMAQFEEQLIQEALADYEYPEGFDHHLLWAFAGVEILRRIIGLAQLPLALSLPEKAILLEEAAAHIVKN